MTHRAVNDILKQRFLHATLSMAPAFLKEMTHWDSLSKSMTLAVCVCVCMHTHTCMEAKDRGISYEERQERNPKF